MLDDSTYPITPHFVETSLYRAIVLRMEIVKDTGIPLHVVGAAGTGKSTALRKIANSSKSIFYCEASAASKSTKGMLEMLCDTVQSYPSGHQIKHLVRSLTHTLMRDQDIMTKTIQRKILIVDEVQQLEPTALRELLSIRERADFALILSGNEDALADRSKISNRALAQIKSRVPYRLNASIKHDEGDISRLCNAYGLDGMDAYRFCNAYVARYTLRELCFLLTTARSSCSNGKALQKHNLELAAITLIGSSEYRDLVKSMSQSEKGEQIYVAQ